MRPTSLESTNVVGSSRFSASLTNTKVQCGENMTCVTPMYRLCGDTLEIVSEQQNPSRKRVLGATTGMQKSAWRDSRRLETTTPHSSTTGRSPKDRSLVAISVNIVDLSRTRLPMTCTASLTPTGLKSASLLRALYVSLDIIRVS